MLPTLSCLGHLPRTQWRDTFEFIVGDNRFVCDSLIADFVSRRVARLHEADGAAILRRSSPLDHSNRPEQYAFFIELAENT
jgi:hypothetical protein